MTITTPSEQDDDSHPFSAAVQVACLLRNCNNFQVQMLRVYFESQRYMKSLGNGQV